jgi:hypothetical protein
VVLPYFEPGACALQNNLESYASRRSLISIVSSGRSDERSRAAPGIIKAMTTGIPETTRKRFRKKVVARIWRKALMPCYYNCPHEYIVRERDLGNLGHLQAHSIQVTSRSSTLASSVARKSMFGIGQPRAIKSASV